ncbi:MAG: MFS transporter [Xanthobacteraceae bacterium]|nr:MFS transporter [Xanthobacteraceae bacterium]
MHKPVPPAIGGIPPLIKRNTLLLALSQSFVGAGTQLAYGIGPLMVIAVTGSASLAGLTVGLFGISRFLVSYPIGQITDTYGRKPGILFGQGLAMIGAFASGFAMLAGSAIGLTLGMVIFTMGISASQQMRVAATDMYLPRQRGLALGFLATGSLVGVALSPLVMALAEFVGHRTGHDPLGLPWLMMPALILAGMILVTFVHPDPKEIGMNLERFYPGYLPPARRSAGELADFNSWDLLRRTPTRLAILSNCAGQGNMAIVMVLTSLVLSHHGHSLTAITISHMFHSAGMFAFTIPLGWASDRYGREWVMYPGVGTALVGALFVAFSEGFLTVTLGTFLVGLGWCAANVASTALIADEVETQHRGRAIGVSESGAGAMTVVAAAVTGPLVECASLPAAGIAAVAIAVVPLLMLAWTKIVQLRAG